jgi:hypothetical protein
MKLRRIASRALLCLTVVGLIGWISPSTYASQAGRVSRLSVDEQAELLQYAADTWRSFELLAQPSGLPADSLSRDGKGWGNPSLQTSPTNIAAYLWSTLAASRLKLIGAEECRQRIERTFGSLERMERHQGFFWNEIDPRTGTVMRISPIDSSPHPPLVSAVDNAWLAVALVMVANTEPTLRDRAHKLLEPMDFRFFYDPYEAGDPDAHPGQLRVGYVAGERTLFGHFGMLNSEARIASYLGIMRKQLPREHYYRLYRTLPEKFGPQEQVPQGVDREYLGVRVFEGTYSYRGARIVPSWGGSMFEALMVTLFVPEDVWAPKSWGINHPLYVRAQIEYGLEEANYGFWGFSPAQSPRGGYQLYGVKALGTDPLGYLSYDVGPPVSHILQSRPNARTAHGVVTPHASFLSLRFAPRQAIANLRGLTSRFPIYSPLGFQDSVDVAAGVVSGYILAVDQGMIMAAIANELANDVMQHAFSDGAVEEAVRPLIAMEEFSAGPLANMALTSSRAGLLQSLEWTVK